MPIPEGNHTDWPWPASLIPRKWTAFNSTVPPVKILGTERVEDNLDIPEPGKWVIAGVGRIPIPVYFAWTSKRLWHVRIGLFRYTYPDPQGGGGYYAFPTFTIKRLY